MNLQEIRIYVEDKKSQQKLLRQQLGESRIAVVYKEKRVENLIKARWLFTEASRLTQMKVKEKIESLVTMAIQAVFEKDIKFIVDFEIKRNKSEVLLRVVEGEKEPYIPKEDKGGGMLDVISFALRTVLWSMEKPRSRNTFILDEPGKWTGVLITRFGEMIKQISEKLKIQMVMVTHDPELIAVADRAWDVEHNGEYSEVKMIGEGNEN